MGGLVVLAQRDELAEKRAEKVAVDEWLKENPVDDAGFPSQPRPENSAPETAAGDLREYGTSEMDDLAAQVRAAGMDGKGNGMSVDTQQYLNMVDTSTPETQKATCNEAGDAAASDAAQLQAKADDFRRSAAKMTSRGMQPAASKLRREAAAAEETADKRRGTAAAFYAKAEEVAAS
ncbi:hypothetical protein ACFWMR_02065 [Amycolatopsis thailandensis]|uniref:hypothetical protein n=1 Tax=Amycolatopsis thailandensis TaxID=589330 RepID=UPI003665EA8C